MDVEVNIRIPSFAQNPSALFTTAPTCPNSSVTGFTWLVVADNDLAQDDPNGYDEWGFRKITLRVRFRIIRNSGSGAATGAATVRGRWD